MNLRPLLLGVVVLAPGVARADDCPLPTETACYADPTCDQYCEPAIATASYSQPVLAPVPPSMPGYIVAANTAPYDAAIDPVKISGLRATYASQAQSDRSAYVQEGLGNAPWVVRHLPWYSNGDRVDSCDEFVYERWYDYSEYEDAVTLHGSDYRTIFEGTWAALADGVASRTGGSVAETPIAVWRAPKNAFFLLDPAYPAGTEALQHPFSATAQELFTHLAQGRQAFTHSIAWHRSMSDELQGYSDDLLYALADKQRDFAALVAQRDAIMRRWHNFENAVGAAAAVCPLPPETPLSQWPWKKIWDPYEELRWGIDLAQYYDPGAFEGLVIETPPALAALVDAPAVFDSPLLRLMLAAQDPVTMTQTYSFQDQTVIDPTPLGCGQYTGPDGLPSVSEVACDDVQADNCLPSIKEFVAQRLAALDAEIDAALEQVAPYGCLAYEEGISLDINEPPHLFASPCDWNPAMYVQEMTNQFGPRREEEYRECVRVVGPYFGDPEHTIHHPSWITPTQDFATSSEQVLLYIALAKQAASQVAFGTDRDGNAIPGHSAGDESNMGSDMFGVEYGYGAGWTLTGLPTEGSLCDAGILAYASADVAARALGGRLPLLELDASVADEAGAATTRQGRRSLTLKVLDNYILAESTGPEGVSPALTFHVAKEASSEANVADARIPVVGFFVHIVAGVAGRVGLNFDTAITASGSCPGLTTEVTGRIEPWTSLDVFVSGGLDIAVVEIGLRIDLTLLKLALPLELNFALRPQGSDLWIDATPKLSMKLTALSGRLRAFADFPLADPIYVTLFEWDGIDLASHTLFAPTWHYALSLVNLGLKLNGGE